MRSVAIETEPETGGWQERRSLWKPLQAVLLDLGVGELVNHLVYSQDSSTDFIAPMFMIGPRGDHSDDVCGAIGCVHTLVDNGMRSFYVRLYCACNCEWLSMHATYTTRMIFALSQNFIGGRQITILWCSHDTFTIIIIIVIQYTIIILTMTAVATWVTRRNFLTATSTADNAVES